MLDLPSAPARFGQLECSSRDVAGIGDAPLAFEVRGEAIERVGGIGAPTERGKDVGAPLHGALIVGCAVESGSVGRE
jgi:hypothetical protein